MRRANRGISVWEVLVGTIGILLLVAILFPVFAQSKGVSRRSEISGIRMCAMGISTYTADFDDVFPYVRTHQKMVEVTRSHMRDDEIWKTRNSQRPDVFHFNPSLPGVDLQKVIAPADSLMLFDIFGRFAYGRDSGPQTFPVAYVDGHARSLAEKAWLAAQPSLYLELGRIGKPLD